MVWQDVGLAGVRSSWGVLGLAEAVRGASELSVSLSFLGGEGVLREAQSPSLVVGCCLIRYLCSASIVD